MSDITVSPAGAGRYRVEVGQGSKSTQHDVAVPPGMVEELGLAGTDEATLVRESFAFLLEREPASSILRQFELPVIGRYFPEYPEEIRRRLG